MKMKKTWKRVVAALFAVTMVITGIPQTTYAKEYWPKGPSVEAKSAIVMEVNTGTILYEKKSHTKRFPASITKIMTTLLAIEICDMDEKVTFSEDAVFKNEGNTSHISRNLGEKLTVEQCIYAVMLESANECAYALGEHIGEKLGGDYRTFIDLMNKRAKELGCVNTHFNNCNGLPDENHYVCAYDMALISAEAYKNETFRTVCGSTSYTIPKTNKCKEPYYCHNHHKMIYPWQGDDSQLYDYCTGGKTGYTDVARNTLVSFAEKDGITLVCVVMKDEKPYHYTDTRKLFEYCFDNFKALNILENESSLTSDTKSTGLQNTNSSFVKLDKDAYIIMPKTAEFSDAKFEEDKEIAGTGTVAKLKYTYADRVVGSAAIVTTGAKVDNSYFSQDKKSNQKGEERVIWIKPVHIVLGILALALLIVLIYFAKRFYDNFYRIQHRWELRRDEKERFREVKKKRYRRKDRIFK